MSSKQEATDQSKENIEISLADSDRIELIANLILDIISEEQEIVLGEQP